MEAAQDHTDTDDEGPKARAYEGTGMGPSCTAMTLMIIFRTCCWYCVVGAGLFKAELALLIPAAGIYWCVFDGASFIGLAETRVFGLPVIGPPSQRIVHGCLWFFMALYMVKWFTKV